MRQIFRSHEIPRTSPENMVIYLKDYKDRKKEEMIAAARIARDEAVSYHDFKVGAAALSKDPNLRPGEYIIYSGSNYKPEERLEQGINKRCAERRAIEQAIGNQSQKIVALVSVSSEISTGDFTRAHDALHPCDECRKMLREARSQGIMDGSTIICNVNDSRLGPDGKFAEEERTLDELLSLYENKSESAAA